MTFGNQKLPNTDHPFLRSCPDPGSHSMLADDKDRLALTTEGTPNSRVTKAIFEGMEDHMRFCALALIIDPPAVSPPSESLHQLMLDFINDAKNRYGAMGGYWKDRLYLCALPDIELPAANKLAEELVARLAVQRPETVSIGIAPFPMLTYDRRHTWNNACKALDHAAFLGPGSIVTVDAVSLNISGDRHYHLGELDNAVAEYSAALELDPNNTNVRNSLGVCFADQDDAAAAETEFRIVTEINPAEPMAWYNLGMLSRMEGRDQTSLEYFERAYALKGDHYEIPYQIGRLLSEQSRWKEALEYAEKAAALSQGHWPVHSLMGLCLAALDRVPEAIEAYTCSVKSNPNNAWDLSALGCLYDARDENPEICRTFLEQSVALAPDNGLFHSRLGQWHHKHKQYEEAMAAYRQASAWGHDSTLQMESLEAVWQNESDRNSRRAG